MRSYSAKIGRWRRETLATLKDRAFATLVSLMVVPHRIVHHVLLFLEKKFDEGTIATRGNHLAQLTVGKSTKFAAEFSDRAADCTWIEHAILPLVDDAAQHSTLLQLGLLFLLHHATGFDRRIGQVCARFFL